MTTGKALTGLEISGKAVNGAPAYHLSGFYPVTANGERLGVCVVAIDITDRKRIEDGQLSLTRSAVNALASSVETCDQYTFGHQERVATIAVAIANLLGLVKAEVDTIWLAARIHDVGKLAIPAEILSRPGRLKPAEMELVRQHAQESANMLERVDFPEEVRELVLQHHERLDGSGYPRGLRGDEILMGARIITVSDVVEAMASHRPYWPAPGIELALKELRRGSGSLYDPDVVNACLRAFREGLVSLDHDV
jgi:putative nucleotidyltransferase with HDIG domain